MATDTDELVLSISADTRQIKRSLDKLVSDTKRTTTAIEREFGGLSNVAGKTARDIGKIDAAVVKAGKSSTALTSLFKGGGAAIIGGAGVAQAAQRFAELIDASTRITNALKVAGVEGDRLDKTYTDLANTAKQNGASFEALATLYARVTTSSKELGVTSEQTQQFIDRMAQGLKASGTDSQAASDGIRQLTQALASGLLRGDEFNSVMENLPVVARAIAKGLGVTVGELRKMAEGGQLTAKVVFDAFIKGSADFAKQAGKTQATFGQSMENLNTALIEAAGRFNEASGASQAFAESINGVIALAGQLNDLVKGATSIFGGEGIDAADATVAGLKGAFPLLTAQLEILKLINAENEKAKALAADTGPRQDARNDRAAAAALAEAAVQRQQQAVTALFEELIKTRDAMGDLADAQKEAGNTASADKLTAAYEKLNTEMFHGTPTVETMTEAMEVLRDTGTEAGAALADGIAKFKKELEDAAAGVHAPEEAVRQMAATVTQTLGTALDGIVTKLESWQNPLGKFLAQLAEAIRNTDALAASTGAVNQQLKNNPGFVPGVNGIAGTPGGLTQGNVTFGSPSEAKSFLKTRANSLAAADSFKRVEMLNDDYAEALAKVLQQFPGLTINQAARSFDDQKRIWDSGVRPAARPGHSRHESNEAADFNLAGLSEERIQAIEAAARRAGLDNPVPNDRGHFQFAGQRHFQPGGSVNDETDTGSGREPSKNFEEQFAQNAKLIEQGREELRIREDATLSLDAREEALARQKVAIDAASIAEGLLNDAKRDGLAITPELTASINAQAQSLAQLGLSNEKAADAMEATRQKSEEMKAAQEQAAAAFAGIAKNFVGGFISDMMHGASATDALRNALGRLADQLLDMALNSIFDPKNFLGGGGGGGGLGGLFSGLFGGGGASASTIAALPVGLFAKGGVVGDPDMPYHPADPRDFKHAKSYLRGGMPGRPPGAIPVYAHPGEVILPKNMVNAAARPDKVVGDVTNNIGDVTVDMSETGMVASSTESGKLLGRQIQAAVEVVLVRESRPGGILRKQGTM